MNGWYGDSTTSAPGQSDGFPVFWREFLGEPFLHAEPVFRDAPGMKRLDGGIRELPGRNGNDYVHHFAGLPGMAASTRATVEESSACSSRMSSSQLQPQFSRNGLRPFQKFRKAVRRKFLKDAR